MSNDISILMWVTILAVYEDRLPKFTRACAGLVVGMCVLLMTVSLIQRFVP